ncbi:MULTISPECIES: anti-sigma-D factor RsdA [unclassified Rhodococcus (in: high G+C Gram-positive bacteria)]|uniref:anti-sigma-D factor RsdA n=1 Tax=unclassified Rhodococcus (in: high G+C Gram-positive bacteria) TaxID=192944 RepID=UPI001639DD33|nr:MULTISPECIES: anti-sigma-D factor RsdA [unclassified Rhodococcus (in: high G+C Gram-positive bacteria)]MBC2640678.1 type IV secretion protein Rhs [Rhodococcus sp. 3A]MBC2894577.1 type IV secretion protein Rhs [Rhodococcus sp. 4CII]
MRGVARSINGNGNPDADLPEDDAPVDVAAVRRDDALIDAIAGGGPVAPGSSEQDQLALLLTSWRADIVATPMPTGPLLDDVIAAIDASDARSARSAARGKLRLLRPIAGAAAAIAVIVGGATIFSYNAEPGDPLWSVKSVVFSQQADSTVAQIDTTSQLQEAERLIAAGDAEAARHLLDNAADRAGGVRDADMRNELDVWRAKLAAEIEKLAPTTPPATTTPGTTTTVAPIQTTELPAIVPGTPGSMTAPGVEQSPGTLPTDLQIPGVPPTSLPPLPTTTLPPETLPSTIPEPTITVVPTPEPPLPVPSDYPTTQPPAPVPSENPITQPPPPVPSENPITQPPIEQPPIEQPPQEPSSAPSSAPLPLPAPTS